MKSIPHHHLIEFSNGHIDACTRISVMRDIQSQVESDFEEDAAEHDSHSHTPMIKMLVSDVVAGAVIGKGGSAIRDMQSSSGALVRVSQPRDYYPETSERTVVLSGSVDSILQAQRIIWQKIAQFSKPKDRGPVCDVTYVAGKVLIPNECGGLIIGRGGSSIRTVQEEYAARLHVTPSDSDASRISRERVVTVTGSLESCIKASGWIAIKLAESSHLSYRNQSTSYTRIQSSTSRIETTDK